MTRVVDLGTKTGGALDEFRRVGGEFFGDAAEDVPPGRCLGVDLKPEYAGEVRAKGYRFGAWDATDPLAWEGRFASIPRADFFLLWDFLEHLPSREAADDVLSRAIAYANVGVWLRMPSFEQDARGEGPLRELGLRFSWTDWKGHPTPYRLADAARVVESAGSLAREYKVKRGAALIASTRDPRVVPVGAPVDTVRYSHGLGPKPDVAFDPPLVGQWEFLIWTK